MSGTPTPTLWSLGTCPRVYRDFTSVWPPVRLIPLLTSPVTHGCYHETEPGFTRCKSSMHPTTATAVTLTSSQEAVPIRNLKETFIRPTPTCCDRKKTQVNRKPRALLETWNNDGTKLEMFSFPQRHHYTAVYFLFLHCSDSVGWATAEVSKFSSTNCQHFSSISCTRSDARKVGQYSIKWITFD